MIEKNEVIIIINKNIIYNYSSIITILFRMTFRMKNLKRIHIFFFIREKFHQIK